MSLIGGSLDPASISAPAAIFGSLSGALASSAGTWITQRHQGRREIFAQRLFHRKQSYSDSINEGAHVAADAIQRKAYDSNQLSPIYAPLIRMRLSLSTDVLGSAEHVIQQFFSTYSEPNLAPEEFQFRAAKREGPLRGFNRICRAELEAIQKQLP